MKLILYLIAPFTSKPTMSPNYGVVRSDTEIPSVVQPEEYYYDILPSQNPDIDYPIPDHASVTIGAFFACDVVLQKRMAAFIQASCEKNREDEFLSHVVSTFFSWIMYLSLILGGHDEWNLT